jgi:hypothetical protein
VAVGIERDECPAKIHVGRRLQDFQPASAPFGMRSIDRTGIVDGEADFRTTGRVAVRSATFFDLAARRE